MTTTFTPAPGRPAESANRIADDLRGQIVTGRLIPGEQIPTRAEIERRFGAGPATVQRALERLRRDGFVQVNGKQGTFVAPNPPHLTRYAIAFPVLPSERAWTRFWTALANQVIALEHSQHRPEGLRLPIYYGLIRRSDSPDYLQLEEEVRSHRVAGIIFPSSTYHVAGSPLLEESDVPRVVIAGGGEGNAPLVRLNGDSFQVRALDYLVARGRRRVAIIAPPLRQSDKDDWARHIRERGIETPPFWFHWVHQQAADAAHNLVRLLMREGPQQRPDALIIGDDNLADHALAGLIASGVRVPEDVEVVAHCNFPCPEPGVLPVKRLGFDARQIVAACVESIDRQRRGEDVPPLTMIPALFEEEVAPECFGS